MIRHKPCPACATETRHVLLWRKNGCDVVKCAACGLGSAAAEKFDPAAYYTAAYFDGTAADGYADYAGSESVIRAEFGGIVEALRRIVPHGKLLEIGAAYGFFLMEAQAYFDVRGVEMADEAAAFARSRGLNVISGPATREVFAQGGPVDAVVMLDAIEHLEDPAAVVQLCAEHLKPGGVVLITTGDFGAPLARLSGSRWRLMTPPQHLWYFTPNSLGKMAARFGLRVETATHPWKRVPLALVLYQLGRMLGVKLSAEHLAPFGRFGLPLNLYDAMRVTLRKS